MKFKLFFIGLIIGLGFHINLNAQISCPTINVFGYSGSLPNPCSDFYTFTSVIQSYSPSTYSVTFNFGDSSPNSTFSLTQTSSTSQAFYLNPSHTYSTPGIYTVTLTVNGPGTCSVSTTKSVSVMCSSCPTYSVLSTGFDRTTNAPFVSNIGNFDPYWYVVRRQDVTLGPGYTPIPGTIVNYTGILAYDIIPNGGYGTSLPTGNAKYISLNPTYTSVYSTQNIVTYRTYFNLPSVLPSNKTYSLALSMRCDDGIYQVTLNGTDIKAPGYVSPGNSYGGDPLIVSVNSCTNPAFIGGSNYIDITVGDLGLTATQLVSEIMLYECSATCPTTPPLPCSDCISSFAPIPGKKYLISAWVKEKNAPQSKTSYTNPNITILFPSIAGSFGPIAPSGSIIDGWQRVESEFIIPVATTNMSIKLDCASGDCYFDDVRVIPFDGSMKSYVYDPVTMRLVAELDERNYATLYEYDEEGKLVRVKKETEKGVMTIQENRNNTKK